MLSATLALWSIACALSGLAIVKDHLMRAAILAGAAVLLATASIVVGGGR